MTMFESTSKFATLRILSYLLTKSSPEVLYNSVATSPDRLAKIKNTTLFFEDLKADKLPQWLFVSMRSKIRTLAIIR